MELGSILDFHLAGNSGVDADYMMTVFNASALSCGGGVVVHGTLTIIGLVVSGATVIGLNTKHVGLSNVDNTSRFEKAYIHNCATCY